MKTAEKQTLHAAGGRDRLQKIGSLAKILLAVLAGLLLANADLLGAQSPLAVSLNGALPLPMAIGGYLGSLAGFFLSGRLPGGYAELAAGLMILGIRAIAGDFFRRHPGGVLRSVLTGGCMLLTGMAAAVFAGGDAVVILAMICRAVLTGCCVYFLDRVAGSVRSEGRLPLSGVAGASLGILFLLGVTSLCATSIGPFNLGRAIGILVTLLAACRFRHLGGVLCGALAACGVMLYSSDMGAAAMILPAAGLAAGLFADFGRLPTALVFAAANAVGLIALGVTPETARVLVDGAVAGVAFVLLPHHFPNELLGISSLSGKESGDRLGADRLDFAARTLTEVRHNVEMVASALERQIRETDMVATVCDRVCAHCRNNLTCWEQNFDRSSDLFIQLKAKTARKGRLSEKDLPDEMSGCFKPRELAEAFNEALQEETGRLAARRRIGEMRGLFYQQMISSEEMLQEISEVLASPHTTDQELSQRICAMLKDNGGSNVHTDVRWDSRGHMRVEAFYAGDLKIPDEELAEDIAILTAREMAPPRFFRAKGRTRLCMAEMPAYQADVGSAQRSANAGEACGDSVRSFSDGLGNLYLLLSDGMGAGGLAAVDSRMTVSLLSRLLKAGVGFSPAVRLLNSSMRVKGAPGGRESFATLDMAAVDLYTGRLELYKLGAAATFVKSGRRVIKVEAQALPMGILEDLQEEHRTASLREGDVIVMLSDGVDESIWPFVKGRLLAPELPDAQTLAQEILQEASSLSECTKFPADDCSVFVAIIQNSDKERK